MHRVHPKPEEPKLEKPNAEWAGPEEILKKEETLEEVLKDEGKLVPSPKQEIHIWPEAKQTPILSFPKKQHCP